MASKRIPAGTTEWGRDDGGLILYRHVAPFVVDGIVYTPPTFRDGREVVRPMLQLIEDADGAHARARHHPHPPTDDELDEWVASW